MQATGAATRSATFLCTKVGAGVRDRFRCEGTMAVNMETLPSNGGSPFFVAGRLPNPNDQSLEVLGSSEGPSRYAMRPMRSGPRRHYTLSLVMSRGGLHLAMDGEGAPILDPKSTRGCIDINRRGTPGFEVGSMS